MSQKKSRKKNKTGTQYIVEHHVQYKSETHPRAQNDITAWVGQGDHLVITDVQHRIAKDNEAMGWCLLWEGLKRIMAGRLKALNKEALHGRRSKRTCKVNRKNS